MNRNYEPLELLLACVMTPIAAKCLLIAEFLPHGGSLEREILPQLPRITSK